MNFFNKAIFLRSRSGSQQRYNLTLFIITVYNLKFLYLGKPFLRSLLLRSVVVRSLRLAQGVENALR